MENSVSFPIHEAFCYNAESDEWFADNDASLNPTVSPNLISMIFPAENIILHWKQNVPQKVWCNNHQRYELWNKVWSNPHDCYESTEESASNRHCDLKERCCILDRLPIENAILPALGLWRWVIMQNSPQDDLEITAEWLRITWENQFIWKRLSYALVPKIEIRRHSYKINLMNQSVVGDAGYDKKNLPMFPYVLSKRVLEIISKLLVIINGKFTLLPIAMTKYGININDIRRIVNYPHDVHIAFLKRFLGNVFGKIYCIEDTANHYDIICVYLGIKPPDSVRKEYLKNPYSLILYFWLIKLGFKDINAIRLFFSDTIMGQIYFNKVYFDPLSRTISGFKLPYVNRCMDFVFFVRWMLRNGKNEMVLAKQITKLMNNSWRNWHDDTVKMFHDYCPLLSEEIKNLVKKKGLCGETHDALVHESYGIDMKKISITYESPMIKKLDSTVNGLKFHVVTETDELPIIGRRLSNCVASYASRMINKECLIVTASDYNDYQVCMEVLIKGKNDNGVVNKLSMVQCLGKYNSYLTGANLIACRNWVKQNRIEIDCDDI